MKTPSQLPVGSICRFETPVPGKPPTVDRILKLSGDYSGHNRAISYWGYFELMETIPTEEEFQKEVLNNHVIPHTLAIWDHMEEANRVTPEDPEGNNRQLVLGEPLEAEIHDTHVRLKSSPGATGEQITNILSHLLSPGKWVIEDKTHQGRNIATLIETGDTKSGKAQGNDIHIGFWDSKSWHRPKLREWGISSTWEEIKTQLINGDTVLLNRIKMEIEPRIPETWSWIIPADSSGRAIDSASQTALLEAFTSRFSLHVIHNGRGLPKNIEIIQPENPLLENTRVFEMKNILRTKPETLENMSSFLTGFFTHRSYAPIQETPEGEE